MFRAVYSSAAAFTTAPGVDGKQVKSDIFQIRRGVVQGDITSPLYFILALDYLFHLHDNVAGKGVTFGDIMIHTLRYADDAALADEDNPAGIIHATARVNDIAQGSRKDADISLSRKPR